MKEATSAREELRRAGQHFLSQVIGLASGTILGQALVILTVPVLTRLYSPAEFGAFAVFSAVWAGIAVAACLRMELAIPLAGTAREVGSLTTLCAYSSLLVGGAWLILGSALMHWLPAYTGGLSWGVFVMLPAAGTIWVASQRTAWAMAIRSGKFGSIGQAKIRQSIGMVGVQVGLGWLGAGVIGLCGGSVVGQGASAGYLRRKVKAPPMIQYLARACGRKGQPRLRTLLYRFRRFPLWSGPAEFASALSLSAPAVLIGVFYSAAAGGYVLLAMKLIGLPMKLVGKAIGDVHHGDTAAAVRGDPTAFGASFRFAIGTAALVGAVAALVLIAQGERLFRIAFGDEWISSANIAIALVPVMLARLLYGSVGGTWVALERLRTEFLLSSVRLLGVVGSMVTAYLLGLDEMGAIWSYSVVVSAIYIVGTIVAWSALEPSRKP